MQKILIMTDTCSDLDESTYKELGIKCLSFTITIDDISFKETLDKTTKEFYEMMDNSSNLPKTSQITPFEFEETYESIFKEGYTDLIYVSISDTGSQTFKNSLQAKDSFYENNPEAFGKMNIYNIDSKGYTGMYGYPVIEAAKKVKKGNAKAEELVAYIEEWCNSSAAYFIPMTLKYAKKSGRISAAAAFAGELLGIKPLIQMADGSSKIMNKIRGEKNIISTLMKCIEEQMVPQTPYLILMGKDDTLAKELEKAMIKKYGYKPEYNCCVGAAVASNAGNDLVGVVCKRKK